MQVRSTLLISGFILLNAALANASSFNGTPHHACEAAAYAQHSSEYAQAEKDFDANEAACYELLDAGRHTSVSLCLKASAASRRETLSDADLALSLALASCVEAL